MDFWTDVVVMMGRNSDPDINFVMCNVFVMPISPCFHLNITILQTLQEKE